MSAMAAFLIVAFMAAQAVLAEEPPAPCAQNDSSDGVKIRFVNCCCKNAWLANPLDDDDPRAPISITLRRPKLTEKFGGVEFVDCYVYDTVDRPALIVHENESQFGVRNLIGSITVHNPHGARAELGANPQGVTLEVRKPAQ
jgi:hypothetical protein